MALAGRHIGKHSPTFSLTARALKSKGTISYQRWSYRILSCSPEVISGRANYSGFTFKFLTLFGLPFLICKIMPGL